MPGSARGARGARGMPAYARVCQHMPGYAYIYQGVFGLGLPGLGGVFPVKGGLESAGKDGSGWVSRLFGAKLLGSV